MTEYMEDVVRTNNIYKVNIVLTPLAARLVKVPPFIKLLNSENPHYMIFEYADTSNKTKRLRISWEHLISFDTEKA